MTTTPVDTSRHQSQTVDPLGPIYPMPYPEAYDHPELVLHNRTKL